MILYWDPLGQTDKSAKAGTELGRCEERIGIPCYLYTILVTLFHLFPGKSPKLGGRLQQYFGDCSTFIQQLAVQVVFLAPEHLWVAEFKNDFVLSTMEFIPVSGILCAPPLPRHGVPCTRKEAIPKKGASAVCFSVFCRLPCNFQFNPWFFWLLPGWSPKHPSHNSQIWKFQNPIGSIKLVYFTSTYIYLP